jgi:hypothetical protein
MYKLTSYEPTIPPLFFVITIVADLGLALPASGQ